jgi:hypothetical protein
MPDHHAKAKQAYAEAMHDLDVPHTGHLTADAVAACRLCDDAGYRGNRVCDHQDHTTAAKRGMELIRQALQKGQQS